MFEQRPWFVNGLNFVLIPWVPFFDPYSTIISNVDQWLRIPRLPWEFWDAACLSDLLKNVGPVVRIDQNTLLRLKGKFARVCVNLNVTQPLPGSILVVRPQGCLRIPLIYEGLHEVCPLCGGESHQLQSCPNLPLTQKVEVLVEKFDATGVTKVSANSSANPMPPSVNETWVTVCPQKRVKSMIQARPRRHSSLNPLAGNRKEDVVPPPSAPFMPCHNPAPLGPEDIILANAAVFKLDNPTDPATDPLDAFNDDLADAEMDDFLNLQNIDDVEMSSDSAKRKRREEGDEASSSGPK